MLRNRFYDILEEILKLIYVLEVENLNWFATPMHMVGYIDFRKLTFGFYITFTEGVVSWQSNLWKCYFIYHKDWIHYNNKNLHVNFMNEVVLARMKIWRTEICHSQSEIHLNKNLSFHSRLSAYHWILDMLDFKQLQLEKIYTDDNCLYTMTK